MKLRNKKTGDIINLDNTNFIITARNNNIVCSLEGTTIKYVYNSLSEFVNDWEDYEEPKEYWYIDCDGEAYSADRLNGFDLDRMLNIGNCFNSREEAEQAVEKLKAVKRLKDKGISFEVKVIDRKWYLAPKAEPEQRTFDEAHDVFKDIMFIFGGEE